MYLFVHLKLTKTNITTDTSSVTFTFVCMIHVCVGCYVVSTVYSYTHEATVFLYNVFQLPPPPPSSPPLCRLARPAQGWGFEYSVTGRFVLNKQKRKTAYQLQRKTSLYHINQVSKTTI